MPASLALNAPGTNIVSNPLSETLLWLPDNTYDIGANGANRPRNVFVGTSMLSGDGSRTSPSFGFGSGGPHIYKGAAGWLSVSNVAKTAPDFVVADDGIRVNPASTISWMGSPDLVGLGAAADLVLLREAANFLAQRNGTSEQNLRVYGSYTDAANFTRLRMGVQSGWTYITTEIAGTGAALPMMIGHTGNHVVNFLQNNLTRWVIDQNGGFGPGTNGNADLGTVSNYVRNVYASGAISTKLVAGTPVDANFINPRDGMITVSTVDKSVYYRSGGVWVKAGTGIDQALTDRVTLLESQVTSLQTQVSTLTARMTQAESDIASLKQQVAALTLLVSQMSSKAIWPGLAAGSPVHLKNQQGDCTAAVIYEDAKQRLDPETISVSYIDPDYPSDWISRKDVRQDLGQSDLPFNSWHVPEAYIPISLLSRLTVARR